MNEYLIFIKNNPWYFVALAIVVVALVVCEVKNLLSGNDKMSVQQLLRLMNDGDIKVIDLRKLAEFKKGHIPDAESIPFEEIESHREQLIALKKEAVVLYCQAGMQSGNVVPKLKKMGVSNVYQLAGGLNGWKEENLPIKK